MLPKTGTCAPFEQHPNQFSHAAPATVPPCSRQYLLRNQPLGNEGFFSSVECGDAVLTSASGEDLPLISWNWLSCPGLPTGFRPSLRHLVLTSTCTLQTHCGRVRGRDEEAPSQQQVKGLTPSPAQPYLRPLGLRLRKSASLLEWLNKKLSEQGGNVVNTYQILGSLGASNERLLHHRQEP